MTLRNRMSISSNLEEGMKPLTWKQKTYNDLTSSEARKEVVKLRQKHKSVRTILNRMVWLCPNIDEIICLHFVCRILTEEGFSFSTREVKTSLNTYYSLEFHLPCQKSELYAYARLTKGKSKFASKTTQNKPNRHSFDLTHTQIPFKKNNE